MADSKISALGEAATVAAADEMALVQGGTTKRVGVDTLFSSANATWAGWIYPYSTGWAGGAGSPLTSVDWDGDSHSTTAKTVIDLSVKFGVPANVKAVLAKVTARDSGSAATIDTWVGLSPNATAGSLCLVVRPGGKTNDAFEDECAVCPCDASGDVYYQLTASGASTMDVYIQVWGYCL